MTKPNERDEALAESICSYMPSNEIDVEVAAHAIADYRAEVTAEVLRWFEDVADRFDHEPGRVQTCVEELRTAIRRAKGEL